MRGHPDALASLWPSVGRAVTLRVQPEARCSNPQNNVGLHLRSLHVLKQSCLQAVKLGLEILKDAPRSSGPHLEVFSSQSDTWAMDYVDYCNGVRLAEAWSLGCGGLSGDSS